MEANGINYYKGVLLCSRPNESPSINKKKEFCGRVNPTEQIGLVPVKQYDEHKTRKRVLPVLNNHKKWLENFKKDIHKHKQQEEKQKQKQQQRLQKIKQEGYEQRQKIKNGTTELSTSKPEVSQTPKKADVNMKRKQKPAWAKTAEENQQSQQKEVDELLDFFSKQQTEDLKDYVTDNDVKGILTELKGKIEKLKEKQDWRKSQLKKIQDDKNNSADEKDNDDILSRISGKSGAQSVSSQKTAERVAELQKKKKDLEWEKMTSSEKKTMASVDEQIAKHVADEVLRNYPHLKHHSNQSVRQLLEKHAHQQIKS